MKRLNLKSLLFLTLVLAACNNDDKVSTGEKKEAIATSTSDSSENLMTFKIDKALIVSPILSISRFDFGTGAGTTLNISSNMNEQHKTIILNINGFKPGHYAIESKPNTSKTPGVAYGSYMPDYLQDMSNPFNFTKGEIVITSIDTTAGIFNATFYGTAKRGQSDSVVISDGNLINGKLKSGITKMY